MISSSPAPVFATETSARPRGWQRHRIIFTALLLAVLAWILYLPSLRYGFVYYDDVRILQNHPELYGQVSLSADLRAIFVDYFPREEPLLVRDISWALDSRIFGFPNAFGYHLGNVLLHGIVVALMFLFLIATTRRYAFASAISAAFLVLAIHTEPVAWIMGRKDILCALFVLLALGAQMRRLSSLSTKTQAGWYLLTVLLFLAGLLSKISALTIPLVLFLHAIFLPYLRGERSAKEPLPFDRMLVREALLAAPLLLISGLIYLWYQHTLEQMGIFDRGYAARGWHHAWNLLMVDPLALWLYLRQIFFPWRLAVLYTWPAFHGTYSVGHITAALGSIGAVLAAGIWLFRRHKDLFFFYAAFMALMIPYLNLLYVGIWVADRYAYFSAVCILALAWSAAQRVMKRQQQFLRFGALGFCVLFLAVNTFQKLNYQKAWPNGETLWQYHLGLPRPSPAAFENLAAYYYSVATEHPDPEHMALPIKKMSIVVEAGLEEFWPDRSQPPPAGTSYLFFLKSLVQEVTGEPEPALQSLLTSDRLRPGFDATILNLARLYRRLAKTVPDAAQHQSYIHAARDRFRQHLSLAFRNRATPPEANQELTAIEAECAVLDSSTTPGDPGKSPALTP